MYVSPRRTRTCDVLHAFEVQRTGKQASWCVCYRHAATTEAAWFGPQAYPYVSSLGYAFWCRLVISRHTTFKISRSKHTCKRVFMHISYKWSLSPLKRNKICSYTVHLNSVAAIRCGLIRFHWSSAEWNYSFFSPRRIYPIIHYILQRYVGHNITVNSFALIRVNF